MLFGRMARPQAISSRTNRGDELDAGAEGFAGMLLQQQRVAHRVRALVLADRDVFHLGGDDARARNASG